MPPSIANNKFISSALPGLSKTLNTAAIYGQDPNKAVTTLNGVNYNYAGDPIETKAPTVVDTAQSDYAKLLTQIKSMQSQQQVYAPKLDFAAINSQARSAAENAVNPYYTKTLNDFLTQQAAKRTQYETQNATNVQNLQDTLKQTLEANALSKERTGADVALNQEQINTQNDQNQQDTGTQFEDQRLADAKALATAGILGSGAGNRATATNAANANTAEGRQNAKFQEQRNQQELFKTRTFEDLAKSGELATANTAKGEKQAKFDLDSYIQNLGFEEQNQRNSLEQQRLSAVGQEQQNQQQLLVNNFINSIADPAKRQAALQAYA